MVRQSGASAGEGDRRRLTNVIGSWLAEAWYQVFPFPRLIAFNRRVRGNSDKVEERQLAWVSLGRQALLPILAEEWDRAKSIDEKLFKLTTALSLAVAAVGVASKAVLDALPVGPLKVGVTVVLLYAIVSLFAGTLMGFSGLRPKPRVGYGPDFALQIRHDNKRSAERIADALKDFEIKNIIRANEASAANMAIRNGVIAFALAMTFSLFLPPKPEPPATPNIRVNVDMRTMISWPCPCGIFPACDHDEGALRRNSSTCEIARQTRGQASGRGE
ncbi:hypothetical protein [Agrobacterium tumefaciens]|uniref:hypothetical protein n=1 Tax=Agrobacterium tumefaciens TaxID=358 RepID=UPI001F2C7ED7|nr:hypothetical protein [Agrobacterium tumefaciens]WCK21762.1 hypothetical protein G6M09_022515 [Agrobacterium tumefaciens]